MEIRIPHPASVLREASFVPRWTRALALLVVTTLAATIQQVIFSDGHAVSHAECRAAGEPRAGERISLPLACVSPGGTRHEYITTHAATVLMMMSAGDRALVCDVMASGRVANCR